MGVSLLIAVKKRREGEREEDNVLAAEAWHGQPQPAAPSRRAPAEELARSLYGRRAKTPTGGSVAQWIAHWTSRG